MLNEEELNNLLSEYENEIKNQLLMEQKNFRRSLPSTNKNTKKSLIWDMISDNIISSYKNELNWIQEFRQKLLENKIKEEKNKMNYQVKEIENKRYIELISSMELLKTENDALDLIALCGEHETNLLLIHQSVLSHDFFKLKTRVAGNMIQKLINYGIRAAAIIPGEINKGRFKEMSMEMNKGQHFRLYENKGEAEKWLLK